MELYSVIGKNLPRVDGILKVTGEARYTGDMVLPGMLYGKILRSRYPHARILKIDTSKAKRLPGVRAVITGEDTPGIAYCPVDIPPHKDQYPLAINKVRYLGDEVAAVAALDEDMAEEALNLIEVEYEVLPAVFDPEQAMKPEAPTIHDDVKNIGALGPFPDYGNVERRIEEARKAGYNNISAYAPVVFGDVEKAFNESHLVREDRFQTQPLSHCQIEPHAALANFDSWVRTPETGKTAFSTL